MATGCQGPFVNGTGGWCGCNCQCCPPADMVTSVTATFGPPVAAMTAAMAPNHIPSYDLNLPGPPQEMPAFDHRAIMSDDRRFLFGGPSQACSVPCPAFQVVIQPGPNNPVCGFQLNGNDIVAVGNGNVNANPLNINVPSCGTIEILLNGQPPPVFVTDGSIITITLNYTDPWNEWCCACVEIIAKSMLSVPSITKSLLRYRIQAGKIMIDPKTGRPIIMVDKKELLRRVIERRQKLRRKKQ